MKKILIVVVLLFVAAAGMGQAAPGDAAPRGYLGVSIAPVEHSPAGAGPDGLAVTEVLPGSGAEAAGLRSRDWITAVAGTPVVTMKDLQVVLTGTRPGDVLEVEVLRDGKPGRFQVTLGDRPAPEARMRLSSSDLRLKGGATLSIAEGRHLIELRESGPRLGVEVQQLRPQLAEHFGVTEGLLVTEVQETGGARDAGLRAGDVILEVEGTPVRRVKDLQQALHGRLPGDTVDLTLRGRDGLQTLAVVLSEPERSENRMVVELAPIGVDSDPATIDISGLAPGESTAGANVWRDAQPSREHLMAEIQMLEKRLQELHEQLRLIEED